MTRVTTCLGWLVGVYVLGVGALCAGFAWGMGAVSRRDAPRWHAVTCMMCDGVGALPRDNGEHMECPLCDCQGAVIISA